MFNEHFIVARSVFFFFFTIPAINSEAFWNVFVALFLSMIFLRILLPRKELKVQASNLDFTQFLIYQLG